MARAMLALPRRKSGPHDRARRLLRFAQGKACAGAGLANARSARIPRLAASLTQQAG